MYDSLKLVVLVGGMHMQVCAKFEFDCEIWYSYQWPVSKGLLHCCRIIAYQLVKINEGKPIYWGSIMDSEPKRWSLKEDSEMLVSNSDVLVEGPQPMQGLDCCHVKYSRTLLIWYMNQPKFFPPEDNSQRRNQLLLILS
ncbi:unnamed protein product [Trifolium pratense]|uniref:Uncharacterized protein n=1 Tax=Trifolium pratense TaxID=57577 RepID=A0ACB0KKM7_TRIPR|nr:unnamed protein product [Trifolium pratense]